MTTNLSVALISFMTRGTPGEVTIEGANICCRATWYQASVTWQIGVAVIEASRCSMTALEAGGKGKKVQKYDFVCEYCSAICEIFTVDGTSWFCRFRKKTPHNSFNPQARIFPASHKEAFSFFFLWTGPFFKNTCVYLECSSYRDGPWAHLYLYEAG